MLLLRMGHKSSISGELDLIGQIRDRFRGIRSSGVALGIGDDCAVLRPPPGSEILVTTDMSHERRHFRRDLHTPESAGHRTLARGLSDIAAMGGAPLAAFLSLALPAETLGTAQGRRWLGRFLDGMHALAEATGTPLAGGDTGESAGALVMADICVLGSAWRGSAMRRSGARVGDRIYVTGALGGAAAELSGMLSRPGRPDAHARGPQTFPEPRLAAGQALRRRRLATACIDLSDGLSTDLTHLCQASAVCAQIDLSALPVHPLALALKGEGEALRAMLDGGEDYELLFTAKPGVAVPRRLGGVRITEIGRVTDGDPLRHRGEAVWITGVGADGRRLPIAPGGWEHFRS